VRLKDHVDALESALARRSQSGANLRGMMAVVVDYAYAARPAFVLEAAIHTGKVLQPFTDAVRRNIPARCPQPQRLWH